MLSEELASLARELDELGRTTAGGAAARPAPAEAVPDFTGTDWRLIREIGRGGMGTVYEAEQVSLSRTVAVKVLPASVSANPSRRARFVRESRTLAMLHHPNIVKVYAAGTAGERLFYAMDRVKGTDLGKAGPFTARELAALGVTAAQALAYAHRCGVIHQDVKPANLLLDEEGGLHLADFGIAALLNGAAAVKSAGGTRKYMAPEMRDGRGVASPATDQYALGVTLLDLAARLREGRVPRDLRAVLRKMTAAEPRARYAGLQAAADDLRRFLDREPVRARRTPVVHRFALWTRRNPAAACCAAVAAACLAGLVAAMAAGYVRTNRALAAAEAARAETEAALAQTEDEAAWAAQMLAETVTAWDSGDRDRRGAQLRRAQEAVAQLVRRFPVNADITNAVSDLARAKSEHDQCRERFRERGGRFPPRRHHAPWYQPAEPATPAGR